jgi:hypothetical protein
VPRGTLRICLTAETAFVPSGVGPTVDVLLKLLGKGQYWLKS